MANGSILNVDFSALKTLTLVYERRSFTAAAEVLNVNQSAVSYTIDKLRKVFGDPLFYRQGGTIVSTARCDAIVESVSGMLEQFQVIAEPETFDPETVEKTVTIACNYYERQILLPSIIAKIRKLAPGIRLKLINATSKGGEQLKGTEADLLLGPLRPDEKDFYCRKLLDEHYVCIMDPANDLACQPLDASRYADCSHVTITYGGTWRSPFLLESAQQGYEMNEVLSVPSPSSLNHVIRGTDLVATVPSRIARAYVGELHVTACPFPAPFEIDLVWTTRTQHAPMYLWLRKLISEHARACQ